VTGAEALHLVNAQQEELRKVKEALKNPVDLQKALNDLLEEKATLLKKLEVFELQALQQIKEELKTKVETIGDIRLIKAKLNLPNVDAMRTLSFELKQVIDNLVLVIAAEIDGKPNVSVMISDNLVKDRQLNATNIVRTLAKEIQGGGGGQPFFATAGGKNLEGLSNVLPKVNELIQVTA
jgi:alanyl-tRNA synthetase